MRTSKRIPWDWVLGSNCQGTNPHRALLRPKGGEEQDVWGMEVLGGLGLRGPACLNQSTSGAHLLVPDPISTLGLTLGSPEPLTGLKDK